MSQIFPRSANTISRLTLVGLAFALPLFVAVWAYYNQSPAATGQGTAVEQPIPFSHRIHAGRLNIDCRYCHTSAETAPFAGMPSTALCMNCHSQIMQGMPGIEKLAASQQTGSPIAWHSAPARSSALPARWRNVSASPAQRRGTCPKAGDAGWTRWPTT